MKRCSVCKQEKSFDDFNPHGARSDGLQSACRSCNKARSKAYYDRNREAHKARVKDRNLRIIGENKARLIEYLLVHPCVDCGETDVRVLEFDHVRGNKESSVSKMVTADATSWKRIEAEIAKCEVRCANDHRRKSTTTLGWYRGGVAQSGRAAVF